MSTKINFSIGWFGSCSDMDTDSWFNICSPFDIWIDPVKCFRVPIILFSQNRQSDKDREKFELDLAADIRSEVMLEKIAKKLEVDIDA